MSRRPLQRQLTVNLKKKKNSFFNKESNSSARASPIFGTSYFVTLARPRREIASSLVMENVHARRQIALSNSEIEYESLKINSRRVRLNLKKNGS